MPIQRKALGIAKRKNEETKPYVWRKSIFGVEEAGVVLKVPKTGLLKGTLNIVVNTVGIGLFTIPGIFRELGMGYATLALFISALAGAISSSFLLVASEFHRERIQLDKPTKVYSKIVKVLMSRRVGILFCIPSVAHILGSLTGYFCVVILYLKHLLEFFIPQFVDNNQYLDYIPLAIIGYIIVEGLGCWCDNTPSEAKSGAQTDKPNQLKKSGTETLPKTEGAETPSDESNKTNQSKPSFSKIWSWFVSNGPFFTGFSKIWSWFLSYGPFLTVLSITSLLIYEQCKSGIPFRYNPLEGKFWAENYSTHSSTIGAFSSVLPTLAMVFLNQHVLLKFAHEMYQTNDLVVEEEVRLEYKEPIESVLKSISFLPVWISQTLILVVYMIAGIAGFMAFGEFTKDNIIENAPFDDWWITARIVSMLALLFSCIPYSVRECSAIVAQFSKYVSEYLNELRGGKEGISEIRDEEVKFEGWKLFVVQTLTYVVVAAISGAAFPDLTTIYRCVGSFIDPWIIYIAPPLCVLKWTYRSSTSLEVTYRGICPCRPKPIYFITIPFILLSLVVFGLGIYFYTSPVS